MDINDTSCLNNLNDSLCARETLNNTYYNVTFDYIHPQGTLITTYSQLFASLQSQVLTNLLYAHVVFLILSIMVIETTRNTSPSWYEIFTKGADKRAIIITLMRSVAGISFILSLFGIFLLISVKMGYNW